MKMPSVAWAFFGLAVLILLGYTLNRGFYIGQDIRAEPFIGTNGNQTIYYSKYCRYLMLTGVQENSMSATARTVMEAERPLCSMFYQ